MIFFLPFFFVQIDWGDFGKSAAVPDTNAAITVEGGIDWGISVESSAAVKALITSVLSVIKSVC